MRSKKGSKGEESRKRLLKAAANEFSIRGFHETKVSEIVKRAGLTQPSFYLYFQSKEAIFKELITDFYSRVRKLTASLLLENGLNTNDVSKRVLSAVETVFQFLAEDKDLTKIGFFLNPEAKQMKKDLAMGLKENLEAEQRHGYFRSDLDMETVAECLIGMIEHLTDSFLLTGIKDPASLAAQVVNLLIYGMLPKGSDVR
ncbi:TetR/AcrR family transcriptional regulator [Bacillus inaquosorum]|uniref:TetR/AcrR family transcriptional regulator n=1 Tax=Bacillus inaquosorum TaxID=483913 RepID=A0A9Q4EVE4_9BACI|nr:MULTISPECIES: TetR/AcrR family transcriptional regulator [Bacillus]MCY7767450.1 TetR/AcrR family transcriptional regulator [Bacillus inaquosorum]MCY7785795.1 TetR/AcrR family transcriptional regulator [Bacillus inaquosorum]MCY7819938.1 TetR/AcrR family transcriptional regulator [Bacillus inaquosorum]MCY7938662.1 TetR/AcrR family transcriptional regulator [Bacillus inaquosorum]MCY7941450.1 TetR/AcrR family transcriptional regulator [Bacillus inaquosorum]